MRFSTEMQRRLRRISIPNLMNYIVGGTVLCYILQMFMFDINKWLYLSRDTLFSGQIWRLVTFIFVPSTGSALFFVLLMYFYWMIGMSLENKWGTSKFSLFYLVGVIGCILAVLITGGYAQNMYLNLSLFFAFAALYPNYEVRVFFILPVKMKWLALLNLAFYIWQFIIGTWSVRVTILLCLANVILFVGGDLLQTIKRESVYWKTRYNFRKQMRK